MNQYLKKTQKNEIHQLIMSLELNPSLFEWIEVDSKYSNFLRVSQLSFKDSPYFFRFDFLSDSSWVEYSPGQNRMVEDIHIGGEWNDNIDHVVIWLVELKKELVAPNMWENLSLDPKSFIDIPQNKFTDQELVSIKSSIIDGKQYLLKQYAGQDEKLTIIEEKLNYLVESTNRFGKKDWIHFCLGVLLTLLSIGIDKVDVIYIWQKIEGAFKSVLDLLP